MGNQKRAHEQTSQEVRNMLNLAFITGAYVLLHPCFENKSARALFQQVRFPGSRYKRALCKHLATTDDTHQCREAPISFDGWEGVLRVGIKLLNIACRVIPSSSDFWTGPATQTREPCATLTCGSLHSTILTITTEAISAQCDVSFQ